MTYNNLKTFKTNDEVLNKIVSNNNIKKFDSDLLQLIYLIPNNGIKYTDFADEDKIVVKRTNSNIVLKNEIKIPEKHKDSIVLDKNEYILGDLLQILENNNFKYCGYDDIIFNYYILEYRDINDIVFFPIKTINYFSEQRIYIQVNKPSIYKDDIVYRLLDSYGLPDIKSFSDIELPLKQYL